MSQTEFRGRCICGWEVVLTDIDEHLRQTKAHRATCKPYQEHERVCFCRGQGGGEAHEIRAPRLGWLCCLWSCAACGVDHAPFEAPARPRGVEVAFWFEEIFSPKLRAEQKARGCTHAPDVLLPMGPTDGPQAKHLGGAWER